MAVHLLLLLLAVWLVSALALVSLCRSAARGDRLTRSVVARHEAVHWAALDR